MWIGSGPWIDHRNATIEVILLFIGIGIRACDLLSSACGIDSHYTQYFNELNELASKVLIRTSIQEVREVLKEVFADFWVPVVQESAECREFDDLCNELTATDARYNDIYLKTELAYILSQFSCLGEGNKSCTVRIMSMLRISGNECEAADVIRQLCIGLESSEEEQRILDSNPCGEELRCHFLGALFKVR
jgi:hypothetical protein